MPQNLKSNAKKSCSLAIPALIGLTLLFIFFSNPFLKIPYDMWAHLNWIAGMHDEGKCFEFFPENVYERCFWHSLWAKFFQATGINDIFEWAKIIHVSQSILAFLAVFYFCKTVLKNILLGIEVSHINCLSYIAVFIWFIGNGTFSVAYQQAWIMWYSVNYQGLTIPLFWYITALTIKIVHEDLSPLKILFYLLQTAAISVLIAKAHSMELSYFLIHLTVILLINARRLLPYFYIVIPVIVSVVVIVRHFVEEQIQLFALLTSGDGLKTVVQRIVEAGSRVVDGRLNRFPDSFSEIAIFSILSGIAFRIFYLYKRKDITSFKIKVFDYVLVTSVFFFMLPTTRVGAGIGSYLIGTPDVVWRFFFASPWFVFLPVIIYALLNCFSKKAGINRAMAANIAIVLILIFSSKYFFYGALFKNAKSIIASIDNSRVGFQYAAEDIDKLKEIILKYEIAKGEKPNIYLVRGDLGPVVRGVMRKYVYMGDRRLPLPTRDSFFKKGLDKKYNLIDITLPPDFPKDEEIFRCFPIDKPM